MTTILLAAFVLLQIADYWTTRRGIEQGARELNPLLLWWKGWLAARGYAGEWTWLVSVKAAAVTVVMLAHAFGAWNSVEGQALLFIVDAAYVAVVTRNYGQIKKQ